MVKLKIGHLYPKEMNIYGDTGNVLVLSRRLKWRKIDHQVVKIPLGQDIPEDIDILVSGGGQDTGQIKVKDDLLDKAPILRDMAKDGVVMLVICGTYQLFGHRFITHKGHEIPGIGIFDMETRAGDKRLIGNIVIETQWGETVGYENHSGQTFLAPGQEPFGKVQKGAGNNGKDLSEGAIVNNVFGSYLHGPLLPKNPHIADELIRRALMRKYGDDEIASLNDTLAIEAADSASKRPR